MRGTDTTDDRGQAFTLEGFVSAMIILTAVLFALQSVVLMPTTGGSGDRATMLQDEREAKDALLVAASAEEENLSWTVRNWDVENGTFANASVFGAPQAEYVNASVMDGTLGQIVHERMGGDAYSIELNHVNETGELESYPLVYQPTAAASDVTASFTVTLFDNQTVTTTDEDGDPVTVSEANEDHDYPIDPHPDIDHDESEVYNYVEVRLTWQR